LTTASYIQINALAEKYPDLVILGFPCNQFGKQEPGANGTEILNGIRHVRPGNNFESKITQFFKKVEVNGAYGIDLYRYLKESCEPTFSTFAYKENLFYDPFEIGDIAWNFEKFLIGRDGKPMWRYHPHLTDPDHLDMNNDLLGAHQQENPFAEEQLQAQKAQPVESPPSDSLPSKKSLEDQFSIVTQKPVPVEQSATKAKLMGKIVVNEAGGR